MQFPSRRSGHTQIISNERGHLNPGISRSLASPWGSFVGTWQVQRKPIQLKTRTKLMNHLSKIDQSSKQSSRAASAKLSRESQRESVASPRPQSAQVSNHQGEEPSKEVEGAQSTHTPNKEDNGSKPPTPASEANRADVSAHGSQVSHSKTPSPVPSAQGEMQKMASPSNGSQVARVASATSTRSGLSHTPTSSASSRAQSAATTRTTPPNQPPSSAHSRVSSVALSYGKEGTQSPLSSTRVSTPHDPSPPAAAASATASDTSSRVQTPLSSPHQNQ